MIRTIAILILLIGLASVPILFGGLSQKPAPVPSGRTEVLFWHFWGGADQDVVESVVSRFNASQEKYHVRAVAMPGNNLQAKLFLSVAGGDPPDLVNQDDPVLADWARRGVILPLDECASHEEVEAVRNWMLDSAQRLSVYDDRMFGACNGLDIRALYYNKTALDSQGLQPPETIEQLDKIARKFTSAPQKFGYLPDSRRLWAWGYVFGGDFVSDERYDQRTIVEFNTPEIAAALNWMASYPKRYGADTVATFRKGDQSLPGKTFPLLPVLDEDLVGRYVMIMDGQWRVRDINRFQQRRREKNLSVPEFGVCPLPVPDLAADGQRIKPRENGGWVNGNFFVVPRGAKHRKGAWEFMKFWIGYSDAGAAAKTCADGGWIPVSHDVIQHPDFQTFLRDNKLFEPFVSLATSPNQFPIPQVPGASMFRRTVEDAAYEAMINPDRPAEEILAEAEIRIQAHLDRSIQSIPQHDQSAGGRDVK